MNINSAEQSLAKYHLLHFVIGAIFALALLAVPKSYGVLLAVFLLSMFLPAFVLPEFVENRWFDRGATLLGGVVLVAAFRLLHRL
jgi:hypothetical protein